MINIQVLKLSVLCNFSLHARNCNLLFIDLPGELEPVYCCGSCFRNCAIWLTIFNVGLCHLSHRCFYSSTRSYFSIMARTKKGSGNCLIVASAEGAYAFCMVPVCRQL